MKKRYVPLLRNTLVNEMETLHIITVLGWLSDFGERSPYNLVTICKTIIRSVPYMVCDVCRDTNGN
ncbi:hypothetical protein VDIAB_100616 [Vibrio diabolicus]|nr:hypothetical protein VDIAB_100616 [Vibrio diabolicus]